MSFPLLSPSVLGLLTLGWGVVAFGFSAWETAAEGVGAPSLPEDIDREETFLTAPFKFPRKRWLCSNSPIFCRRLSASSSAFSRAITAVDHSLMMAISSMYSLWICLGVAIWKSTTLLVSYNFVKHRSGLTERPRPTQITQKETVGGFGHHQGMANNWF